MSVHLKEASLAASGDFGPLGCPVIWVAAIGLGEICLIGTVLKEGWFWNLYAPVLVEPKSVVQLRVALG